MKISVRLRNAIDNSYDIVIGTSLRRAVDDILQTYRRVRYFIITDSNVEDLYAREFLKLMKNRDSTTELLVVDAGEQSKTRRTKERLEDKLLALGATRDSVIIALGGGVIGDLAGFVAATLLRGVRYVQVPTTLLAQVDSSIGGKVAVDHPFGKNLIGAFYQPKKVYIDVATLSTLSEREFSNGMAEVIKYAAILNKELFEYLERHHELIRNRGTRPLLRIVNECCTLKKMIVEKDERESGLRRILNYGHTIGHALEVQSKFRIPHGEAVAIGMVAEARISSSLGLLDQGDISRLEHLLHLFHLPTKIPSNINLNKLILETLHDKKVKRSKVQYTLLQRIGRARVGVGIPHKKALQILAQ